MESASDVPEVNIQSFESMTGAGVKAVMTLSKTSTVHTVYVGTARFITQSDDGYLPAQLSNFEGQEAVLGRTVIFISASTTSRRPLPVLAISMSDVPKASSARAIKSLQSMGIEVNMMTGDGRTTALAIAKEMGIHPDGVWARMSPKGKATVVAELMEKNAGGVAMVSSSSLLRIRLASADTAFDRLAMESMTHQRSLPRTSALRSHRVHRSLLKLRTSF
jgi:P-type Cu+ transporter